MDGLLTREDIYNGGLWGGLFLGWCSLLLYVLVGRRLVTSFLSSLPTIMIMKEISDSLIITSSRKFSFVHSCLFVQLRRSKPGFLFLKSSYTCYNIHIWSATFLFVLIFHLFLCSKCPRPIII